MISREMVQGAKGPGALAQVPEGWGGETDLSSIGELKGRRR